MVLPLQITFHGLDPSPAIEAAVREHATRLERFSCDITSCRVLVEAPHRHHQQGNLFRLRIDLTVPGREIVVGRDPAEHHAHEDPYVAIRDAFDAARRQLEDHARIQRGAVKATASALTAESRSSSPRAVMASSRPKTTVRSIFTATAS